MSPSTSSSGARPRRCCTWCSPRSECSRASTNGVLRHHRVSLVLLTVALGLAAGVLWELYEWVATSIFPSASIAVGYDDTVLDLTMDGSGSLVAGLVLLARRRAGLGTGRRADIGLTA